MTDVSEINSKKKIDLDLN